MKKIFAVVIVLCMILGLAACGNSGTAEQLDQLYETVMSLQSEVNGLVEQQAALAETAAAESESSYSGILIVFAAASMTETLTEIEKLFEAANPDVDVICTFASSGDLVIQITEGAPVDVFISAGQKQMNQIDITAESEINTNGYDYVLEGTRFDILANRIALAVPEGNPAGITSYNDWAQRLGDHSIFMAMGGAGVPVGEYTQKLFAYYGLSEEDLASAGCITYGADVKEVTSYVTEQSVDCGVIYQTDAYSSGLEVVDTATTNMCGQVVYPAAVMKDSSNTELAQAFLDFCCTPEASEIFESVGFSPLA